MSKTWDFTFLFIRSVDSEGYQEMESCNTDLKEHNNSQWHRDAVITSRMAEQAASHQNVLQMQRSVAAKEAEERRLRNRKAYSICIFYGTELHSTHYHI